MDYFIKTRHATEKWSWYYYPEDNFYYLFFGWYCVRVKKEIVDIQWLVLKAGICGCALIELGVMWFALTMVHECCFPWLHWKRTCKRCVIDWTLLDIWSICGKPSGIIAIGWRLGSIYEVGKLVIVHVLIEWTTSIPILCPLSKLRCYSISPHCG